jgi:hypothetical protein
MSGAILTWRMMDWSRKLFFTVGVVSVFGAMMSKDIFLAVMGAYFILKSWFNWGCSAGSCGVKSISNHQE